MADANSAYTLDDVAALKELDDFDLMMIEQPLATDDIVDHARAPEPACRRRSAWTRASTRPTTRASALDLGSGRIINIKVSRLGGLLEAKKVHDLPRRGACRSGAAACTSSASAGPPTWRSPACRASPLPGDVSGSDKYYARDIVEPVILADRGSIALRDEPGIGYTPDEQAIADFTTRSVTLTP